MLLNKKQPSNIAGLMGRDAVQPASMPGVATVDPIEKMMQRVSGRTGGKVLEGIKMKKPSLMNSYRNK